MTYTSRLLAGILLIVLPTVMVGGVSILSLVIGDPTYMENPLRQDLWRAGHAHAGVWLILALVALRYVDEANLSNVMKWLVRGSIPIAAILVPTAFFLSVLPPDATVPNALIYLAYVGAVVLAAGVLVLGIGRWRWRAIRWNADSSNSALAHASEAIRHRRQFWNPQIVCGETSQAEKRTRILFVASLATVQAAPVPRLMARKNCPPPPPSNVLKAGGRI